MLGAARALETSRMPARVFEQLEHGLLAARFLRARVKRNHRLYVERVDLDWLLTATAFLFNKH